MSLPPVWVVPLLIALLGLPVLAQPGPPPVPPPVRHEEAAAPSAALEQALAAQQARCDAKEAELAALREKMSSLALLVASGTLRREGIRVVPLEAADWMVPTTLELGAAALYVATGHVALEVELTLTAGEPPWTPAAAVLEDEANRRLVHATVVRLAEGPVLTAGAKARLVVEFAVSLDGPSKRYEFRVSEQNGTRTVGLRSLELAPPPARKR